MIDNKPLQMLLDGAKNRTDEAAKRLGELLGAERRDAEKLLVLQNYRDEYQNKFTEAARRGIDPHTFRNYQNFLNRLDEAISTQDDIVNKAKRRTVDGQQMWISEHSRMKAFDTLSIRQEKMVEKRQSRQEQKMLDEHSSKNHFRKESEG